MRAHVGFVALIVTLGCAGCVEQPRYVPLRGPGPSAIPPAPRHPKIEGDVDSVSAADIREVIRLKQQELTKEYGKVLPIYTVRVHSHNHIEVEYYSPDGVSIWRDARRVKGKWKFDELSDDIILVDGAASTNTKRSNQTLERTADRREDLLSMTPTQNLQATLAVVSGRSARSR